MHKKLLSHSSHNETTGSRGTVRNYLLLCDFNPMHFTHGKHVLSSCGYLALVERSVRQQKVYFQNAFALCLLKIFCRDPCNQHFELHACKYSAQKDFKHVNVTRIYTMRHASTTWRAPDGSSTGTSLGDIAQWQRVRFACGRPRVQTPVSPILFGFLRLSWPKTQFRPGFINSSFCPLGHLS